MNLEALALRRAEEQVSCRGADVLHDPAYRDRPKLRVVSRPTGGKAPSCVCGSCRLCVKREWMRTWRAGNHVPTTRRGKRMDPDRKCACGNPIAVSNKSGICGACHHTHRAKRIGWVAQRAQHYSHGGGI